MARKFIYRLLGTSGAFIVVLGISILLLADDPARKTTQVRVACIGDSTTQGAGVKDRATESYPAQLQTLLGDGYQVSNLGVGSCTLIRKGNPNVWKTLDRLRATNLNPDLVIISLGTNDTCGGKRKCWDHKDDYPRDYRDLIEELRALPSKPRIWICAPTPMVVETPALSDARKQDLRERVPRLQELIGAIKEIVNEKKVGFIDLNTPLVGKPELFKDGVHMNKDGYQAMAKVVQQELQKTLGAEK